MKIDNLKMPVIQVGTLRTGTPNGVFRGVYIRIYRLVLGFGSNILLPEQSPNQQIHPTENKPGR